MTNASDHLELGSWNPAREEELVREAIRLTAVDPVAMRSSIREMREELERVIGDCNHRLRVLAEWMDRGLVVEAASVEAANGGMCRAAVRLMFSQHRALWDKACVSAGVLANSPISEQAIDRLDRGLVTANKVSAAAEALQVAVLGREPLLKRVKRLRSLFMLMPQNVAIKELVRKYERDSVLEMTAAIQEAIASNNSSAMKMAIEAIDGLQWQSQFSADLTTNLRNAIKSLAEQRSAAEFSRIASAAVEALAASDMWRLGQLEDELSDACQRLGGEPDDATRRRMQPAWDWLAAERTRMRSEAQHAQATAALRDALDQGASWLEIEPIRAKVLETQLGIADDVESRCYTLEQEWKAEKRRANLRWIGVSCVVAVIILGGVGWFMYESSRHQLATEEATRIAAMIDQLDFAEANRALAALSISDPTLLARAPLQAVQKRVSDDEPTFHARRIAVRAVLDRAQQCQDDPTAPEAALREQQGKLDEAIALVGLSAMVHEETVRASALRKAIAHLITARRDEATQRRSEAIAGLRRRSKGIPLIDERPPADRVSAEATKAYQAALTLLQGEIEAFKNGCPADALERAAAEALLDRVSKDLLSAEQLQAKLKKFEEARGQIVAKPISGESWADAARRLRAEYAEILASRALREMEALNAIIACEVPARQIEEWRERVLPAIASRSSSSTVEIPSDQAKATEVREILDLYVRESPESPFRTAAIRWAAVATVAVKIAPHKSIPAALESELAARGLVDLRQVAMEKGAQTGAFVFVRNSGAGAVGIVDHLVRERTDLEVDSATLRGDMKLRERAVLASGRMPVPFSESISKTLGKIGTKDVIQIQSDWLRMVSEIASSSKPTEPVARAAVALGMLRVFVEVLSTSAATSNPFSARVARVLHDYEEVEDADWPRIALTPDKAMSTKAELAIKAINGLKLSAESGRIMSDWTAEVKFSGAVLLVGILPVRLPDVARKTVPNDLEGSHFILVRDPAGAGRWRLAPINISAGSVPTEFEPLDTTLIYADH